MGILAAPGVTPAQAAAFRRQGRRREILSPSLAKLTLDQVAGTPPIVGAISGSTTITTGTTWYPLRNGVIGSTAVDATAPFEFVGVALPKQLGSGAPDYSYIAFDTPSHPNAPSAPYTARFMFDGTTLEILFKNYASFQFQVFVDGYAVSATAATTTGSPVTSWLPITFSTRAARLIEFRSALPFGGVRTGSGDTIWKPPPVAGPRCIVLGDSYTGGTGADAPGITGWVQKFALLMGWPDTWAAGVGGSGYINAGQASKFSARLAADVIAPNPDYVLVVGGHNDDPSHGTGYDVSSFGTAVGATIAALRAGLPAAKIIVVGPLGAANAQGSYSSMQNAMIAAVAGIADLTVDTMNAAAGPVPARPWFAGNGYQGSPTGNGNDDYYIWTDNVHPSQAGHEYIASRLAAAVAAGLDG